MAKKSRQTDDDGLHGSPLLILHTSKVATPSHTCVPQQSARVVQAPGELMQVGVAAVVPVRNQMVFINIFKTFKMHLVGYLYIHWHISSPH